MQASNKDIFKVYPHGILCIAIEDRKSVLYLTNRKIETNYHLDHWKGLLDLKIFAQPHHSFIVNLNYVDEVTKRMGIGKIQRHRIYGLHIFTQNQCIQKSLSEIRRNVI